MGRFVIVATAGDAGAARAALEAIGEGPAAMQLRVPCVLHDATGANAGTATPTHYAGFYESLDGDALNLVQEQFSNAAAVSLGRKFLSAPDGSAVALALVGLYRVIERTGPMGP